MHGHVYMGAEELSAASQLFFLFSTVKQPILKTEQRDVALQSGCSKTAKQFSGACSTGSQSLCYLHSFNSQELQTSVP